MMIKNEAASFTVAEAIAEAEAWNERGALLATIAFELLTLFGGLNDTGNPPYLIKRLTGGASEANPAHVEGLHLELLAAAKQARAQAGAIHSLAAAPSFDGGAVGLSGDHVTPPADHVSVEIPSSGDDIVANPRKSASHPKQQVSSLFIEEEQEEQEEQQQRCSGTEEVAPTPRRSKRARS